MQQSLATCVIVISDLQLGGGALPMMSQPQRLAEFQECLPASGVADETLELVINVMHCQFMRDISCQE